MFKRILALLLCLALAAAMAGCGEKKILHCDHCGVEVAVESDSNMEEDWIIFCEDCNAELFPDGVISD